MKVNIFIWRLGSNNLSTRNNLVKRGLDIPLVHCPLCDVDIESVDHLFFGISLLTICCIRWGCGGAF